MTKKIIIGVSGDEGSFSEQAGLLYAEKINIQVSLSYLIDMENVLAAVETEKVDIGIFPVVNLRGGLVKMAFTAMGNHLFIVLDDFWLEINQCLLALPEIKASEIKKIVSHPQALAQCQNYLKTKFNDAELIPWDDTAKAARDLSSGLLSKDTAVIAPESAASVHGLQILTKNIQDQNPNLTAFIAVKKHA